MGIGPHEISHLMASEISWHGNWHLIRISLYRVFLRQMIAPPWHCPSGDIWYLVALDGSWRMNAHSNCHPVASDTLWHWRPYGIWNLTMEFYFWYFTRRQKTLIGFIVFWFRISAMGWGFSCCIEIIGRSLWTRLGSIFWIQILLLIDHEELPLQVRNNFFTYLFMCEKWRRI